VRTARAVSAGGVVLADLRPDAPVALVAHRSVRGSLQWTLPKGAQEPGETVERTALREVREETGAGGRSLGKLGDVRYVYTWDGERIFKVVSFFLVRYGDGRLGDLPPAYRHEVAEVRWLPLRDAPRLLAYKGEREMAERALARVADLPV
jgi:8-oxo-dGTP pyrophosphatase MutT (NUDIX family)